MAIKDDHMNIEEMHEPLLIIQQGNENNEDHEHQHYRSKNGSIMVVLLSTFIAVLGSYEFGACVSPKPSTLT